MALNIIKWGISNRKISIKIYTLLYLFWLVFFFIAWTSVAITQSATENLAVAILAYMFGLLVFIALPFIPLIVLHNRENPRLQEDKQVKVAKVITEQSSNLNNNLELNTIPTEIRVRLAELSNPMLDAALSSFSNALELLEKEEERHRKTALTEMDQAVEYVLKAVLFQKNSVEFLEKDWEKMTFENALGRLENLGVNLQEKELLRKVHSARNEVQHRGAVPSLSWTRFYLECSRLSV